MGDITLEFKGKLDLKEKWAQEFSLGEFTVYARAPLPQGPHRLFLRISSTDEIVVVPIAVERLVQEASPYGAGMIVKVFCAEAQARKKIDEFFAGIEKREWMGVKNFCPATEAVKPEAEPSAKDNEEQKTLQDALRKAAKVVECGKKMDHYGALGIDRAASKEEIRVAFIRQTRTFHPDNFPGEMLDDQSLGLLEGAYQSANKAHEVLKNKDKKRQYDLTAGRVVKARDESRFDFDVKKREMEYAQYKIKNRENVQKAERIFKDALVALREGDKKAAFANVKIATTYDPLNPEYQEMFKKLQSGK